MGESSAFILITLSLCNWTEFETGKKEMQSSSTLPSQLLILEKEFVMTVADGITIAAS